MRAFSITILQDPKKWELAPHFYGEILKLPHQTSLTTDFLRWFDKPAFLATRAADTANPEEKWGGFTGVQFNVVPASDLNPIVAVLRATGIRQPEPRTVGEVRLLNVFDPSGNSIMLVGSDQMPDEPLIDEAVGSVSLFVADIQRARAFYVDGLGLPVRAEPYEGLVVIGSKEGTALLVYQVPQDRPNTPIGRNTGLAFVDPDPGFILDAAVKAGGKVVHAQDPNERGIILGGTFSDPDGNVLTILSETHLIGDDDLEE